MRPEKVTNVNKMTSIYQICQGCYQNITKGEFGDEPSVQCCKTVCVCSLQMLVISYSYTSIKLSLMQS
jgi:hypothetical protein